MFAYCGNNSVVRIDFPGQLWQEFWNSFTQTLQQANGYFTVAVGVYQIDTPAPGPADAASGILIIGGIIICALIASYDASTTAVEEITEVKYDTPAIYYGADTYGGDWKKVTKPMTLLDALAWVKSTAFTTDEFGKYRYGKHTSWGIYTEKAEDAINFGMILVGLSSAESLVFHRNIVGLYNHYHLPGFSYGRYEHFHIWFGSIYYN